MLFQSNAAVPQQACAGDKSVVLAALEEGSICMVEHRLVRCNELLKCTALTGGQGGRVM